MSITATLNFTSSPDAPGSRPFTHASYVISGSQLHLAPVSVEIQDIREVDVKGRPNFIRNGVELVVCPPTLSRPGEDGDGTSKWAQKYGEDVASWLQEWLGVKRATSWNVHVRRRNPATVDPAYIHPETDQPALRVHVDQSYTQAKKQSREFLILDETVDARTAIINVWRPLHGPVWDAPLTVCDALTTGEEDFDDCLDHYGEHYSVKHNEKQKWYYARDQMPNEVWIFRCFDSTLPLGAPGQAVPHTAFFDDKRVGEGNPRESIEVRCTIEY